MGPLVILILSAFISPIFALDLTEMTAVKGIEVYHNSETLQIEYDAAEIDGYLFTGEPIWELPDTVGMIYQDFYKEIKEGERKTRVDERMVVLAVGETGLLVLGVPHEKKFNPRGSYHKETSSEKTINLAKKFLEHKTMIRKRSWDDGTRKWKLDGPSPTVREVLAEFKREAGKIVAAGVVGLRFTGGKMKMYQAYTSWGFLLARELKLDGGAVKPWVGRTTDIKSWVNLIAITDDGKLTVTIGPQLLMDWKQGETPNFPPWPIYKWGFGSRHGRQLTNTVAPVEPENQGPSGEDCMDIDSGSPTNPPTLQELFKVKTGKNKGGCDEDRQKILNSWFEEAKTLAETGLKAFADASKGNEIAIKTLQQWFSITSKTPQDELKEVREHLEDLRDFYLGEMKLVRDDEPVGAPHLFCGSTWLQQKKRTDSSLDSEGDVKMDEKNSPLQIQDDPKYSDELWVWDKKGKKTPSDQEPYWSEDLKSYIFEVDYQDKGYCSFTGNGGGAEYRTLPYTLEICAKSFTEKNLAAKLNSRGPDKHKLPQLLPRSGILFHESFHLVYTWSSNDATYDVDKILEAIKSPEEVPESINLDAPDLEFEANVDELTNLQLIRGNPETWLFFCVAYWHTLHNGYWFPDGKTGVKID